MNYWKDEKGYVQDQADLLFKQVYKVLDKNPPQIIANDERKLALFALDGLLHDARLDDGIAFKTYMQDVAIRVWNGLSKVRQKKGVTVFKLYNQGFIVQTPTVTIGFDLVRGRTKGAPYIPDSLMKLIVKKCDVLFVSHLHADHADTEVAKLFYSQGKQVLVPPGLWEGVSPLIEHFRGSDLTSKKVKLSVRDKWLTVNVFPGHQDEVLNNVYGVTTPEGYTILHTGDQYQKEDLVWLTKIKEKIKVDILLVHCWMSDLKTVVEGINPAIVLSGHENEMGHSIAHREAYWLTFRRMQNIGYPYVVMAWGEFKTYFK